MSTSKAPKILLLDIETAPHMAYVWGLFKETVSLSQLVKPGFTLCWAAKWLGKSKTHYRSVHHHGHDQMVQDIWKMLDEADAVIHYNGKHFDIPTLNGEFVKLGMTPPSPYHQIDLLQVVRGAFRLASNKLDYVAQYLGIEGKVNHKGMALWTGCMAGNRKDWKVMREYNIWDVQMMEPLYYKLLPWITNHPNMGLYKEGALPTCPNCGSVHLQRRGTRKTKTQVYQQYHCQDCGKWSRARTRLEKTKPGVLS